MSNYVSGKQRVVPLGFQIWGFERKHSDFNVSFRWFCELSEEGTEMKGGYGMRWGVMQVPGHRGFLMLLHVCPTFRKDGSSFKPSLSYCTQKQKRVDHKKKRVWGQKKVKYWGNCFHYNGLQIPWPLKFYVFFLLYFYLSCQHFCWPHIGFKCFNVFK